MEPRNTQTLSDRLALVPKEVKNLLLSDDFKTKITSIAEKHQVTEKTLDLENEATLVMLGFEPVSDLGENIQQELGVAINDAIAIAQDIEAQIFAPIRGILNAMHQDEGAPDTPNIENATESGAPSAPAQPVPQNTQESFAAQKLNTPVESTPQTKIIKTDESMDMYREFPQ